MNISLVPASIEDAPNLLEIQQICFKPLLEKYQDFDLSPAMASLESIIWQVQNENFYKIFMDNVWVGSVSVYKKNDAGAYKLRIINILPQYQNKGIGQKAIQLAEATVPDAKAWILETIADMPLNRHVYEKLGYVFTGDTQRINDRLTLVFYRKEIKKAAYPLF